MIRTSFFSLALLAAVASPAFADQCQDDVGKIEAALASNEIDADKRAQAEDMKSQAVQLCGAGNLDEGLAVTAEAKVLLGLD